MASNKLRTRIIFTSEAVDNMTDAEVRAAYTSIRHIALERFKRLGDKGFQRTRTYKNAEKIGAFPKIGSLTPGELRQTLIDTSLWLRNPYSKVVRMNKRNREAAKAFRKMGYTFIDKNNINDFLDFLDDMKDTYGEKNYGYERVSAAYNEAQRLQIPEKELRENFTIWMKKGALEEIQSIKSKDSADKNSKAVRRVVNKYRNK